MRFYSSLSRRKEELPPAPGPIGMYFCGPTVYQRVHIGNARPFVIAMWLRSWLRGRRHVATEERSDLDLLAEAVGAAWDGAPIAIVPPL